MLIFWALVVPTAMILTLLVIDRFACWAERRGWIYWRHRSRSGGASVLTGPAFEAFNPSVRHVVEERERQRLEVKTAPAGQKKEAAPIEAERASE